MFGKNRNSNQERNTYGTYETGAGAPAAAQEKRGGLLLRALRYILRINWLGILGLALCIVSSCQGYMRWGYGIAAFVVSCIAVSLRKHCRLNVFAYIGLVFSCMVMCVIALVAFGFIIVL
ncbi:MAG: hypothetical protein LUD50_01710 [Clostridia bacterium]|nr:hypothetical protein [Clostridia bacterium]